MRCRKCVVEDRVTGSSFDTEGLCVWCRDGYPNYRPKGVDALRALLQGLRRPDSAIDCIVGVSGGKDSCFTLYTLRETLGMRVEAFTYDHDGVTAAARQNVKNVCDSLGVPLHVVSLRPHKHLHSFRTYFRAWVERPSTVAAGMTCVACKHLHVLGTELAVARRAPMAVWANCPLEYSPFLALKKSGDGVKRDGLLKGSALLAGELLRSGALLAGVLRHLTMTIEGCVAFAPTSPYLRFRYPSVSQVVFFEYWPWEPEQIRRTLIEKAGWRPPQNIPSDWHSDCVFNVFKEYMFQSMFGVSYTDGFLSNQVRYGLLTRDQAMTMLADSKRFYEAAVPQAMEEVGLSHLARRLDPSCFRTAGS